jgi:AcrR family transcriptional regulator
MTLIAEHIETDTRERILVVAERLFRQLGYQKTTVADIAKELRMSPANVYRFFDSKKAIHEGVARTLMGGVEDATEAIAAKRGSAASRLRELMTTIHRMNCERYVGDSKLHEMVEIAMEESWEVCVAHMERITHTIGAVIADGAASGGDVHHHRDDALLPSANDRAMRQQAGPLARPDDRFCPRGAFAARQAGRQIVQLRSPDGANGSARSAAR